MDLEIEFEPETNVIAFPKNKKGTPPQSLAEAKQNVAEAQTMMAIDIAYESIARALVDVCNAGFDPFARTTSANDIMFCVEAVKALILRTVDVEHPFHDIADEVVEIEDPEGILDDFFSYQDPNAS
jgi:hypothetical protein